MNSRQQTPGGLGEHVEDAVKAIVIIGVGNIRQGDGGGESQTHVQALLASGRTDRRQRRVVGLVHGNDVIEFIEIGGDGLAGGEAAQIDATGFGDGLAARIRRPAHVPVAGACRIDGDGLGQALIFEQLAKHPFRRRRAADIPQTDKQNLDQWISPWRKRVRNYHGPGDEVQGIAELMTDTIVVLTGAGISRESGLATFRDADGIWATVRIEDVATPDAFRRDAGRVHAFYNARRAALVERQIAPNGAHLALARLEKNWPGEVLIVTQNVDDLHERAGSENLLHMHGELLKARCSTCAASYPWRTDLSVESCCPTCAGNRCLRPDVVWFGEMPRHMDAVYRALGQCGLFVSIGTSGHVYPAAAFVARAANRPGVKTVELNLEPSEGARLFDQARYGPASQLVPEFVDQLLASP